MDPIKMRETVRRMTEVRALLVRDNPFFGHLAMGLQLACAPCGTACTDGDRLIFDPEFAEKLSDREMQFIVLHEVLHCVLDHCTRGKSLDSLRFNIACDIVVNSTILSMWGIDRMDVAGEEVMHVTPDGQEGRLFNAEEVYAMLPKKPRGDAEKPEGGSGQIDRHDLWRGIVDGERLKDVWKNRIRDAVRMSGGTAKMPQQVRSVVRDLESRSGLDWRQLLHDFIQHDLFDYSFLPPDRRYASTGFFLPAFNVDEDNGSANDLWVCVDTSASISDEELSAAIAEVLDAMRQAGLGGRISFFDGFITDPVPFVSETDLNRIEPTGGGGTSFHSIFECLREKLYPDLPQAILIFTDGYAPWPKEEAAMDVPVLWLITRDGAPDAPWGRTARF